ncbi:hypothetical protein BAUCODRAFT_318024 [Baudoinia panamericana UAMH 10762]|uniref:Uncharacterized protein n=1 Tax=Baudoinia panamericana (strain UAMH 10762) TaxID=717646 RepID=M2LBH5_BAUPA|nr:uncharacterized protein BAUCODRAFT_318024 [Baudoinia panamericana UAMH 10762]EMC91202.1 hypothetical protein BAUCODRAFT_318024 [Baudoinia panamericana UAMH 10762]
MAELTALLCQRAELQTELRLVKEQLAQAQSTIVGFAIASRGHHQQQDFAEFERLQARLDDALVENAQLKHELRGQHGIRRGDISQQLPVTQAQPTDTSRSTTLTHSTLPSTPSDSFSPQDHSEDLLSFDEELPTSIHSNTVFGGSSCQREDIVRTVRHADDSSSSVTAASPANEAVSDTCWGSQVLPTGPRWTFSPRDRSFLLGMACYLEDMSGDEYVQKWHEIARTKGRFSAEAWRDFYEVEVFPAYHKRQAAQERGVGHGLVEGSVDAQDQDEAYLDSQHRQTDHADDGFKASLEGINTDCDKVVNDPVDVAEDESLRTQPCLGEDQGEPDGDDLLNRSQMVPNSVQGLASSRWALKSTAVSPTEPPRSNSMNAGSEMQSLQGLPTLEAFTAMQLSTSQEQDAEVDKPGRDDVRPAPECATLQTNTRTTTVRPSAAGGDHGIGHRGRGRDGGPVAFEKGPRCCHWPQVESQLWHSYFAADHDPRALRTVMITGIPPNVTLAEALDKVVGGRVISAVYLPTSEMRVEPVLETNAVMVTFLDASVAQAYAEACAKDFIFFWSESWQAPLKATVTHIQMPVRLPHGRLIANMYRQELSRVIFLIDDGTNTARTVVERAIAAIYNIQGDVCKYPLRLGRDDDGLLFFEFANVEDAVLAKLGIGRSSDLCAFSKGFLPDPCGRPMETLKRIAHASKPMSGGGGALLVDSAAISPLFLNNDQGRVQSTKPSAVKKTIG